MRFVIEVVILIAGVSFAIVLVKLAAVAWDEMGLTRGARIRKRRDDLLIDVYKEAVKLKVAEKKRLREELKGQPEKLREALDDLEEEWRGR